MRQPDPPSASPPTDRVLDILELLTSPGGAAVTLTDVARRTGITLSTTHAILGALCERGWAVRDPIDRSVSVGPALLLAAERAAEVRHRAGAARAIAVDLAERFGYATSVTERVGHTLLLTHMGGGGNELDALLRGERIPFAAPFGIAFAAWDDPEGQRAWIERGAVGVTSVDPIHRSLEETRRRGFSVERMSPVMTKGAELMRLLGEDPLAATVHELVAEALATVTAASVHTEPDDSTTPITALSAPVHDPHGRAPLNVGVHPFEPLEPTLVEAIGQALTDGARSIGT